MEGTDLLKLNGISVIVVILVKQNPLLRKKCLSAWRNGLEIGSSLRIM